MNFPSSSFRWTGGYPDGLNPLSTQFIPHYRQMLLPNYFASVLLSSAYLHRVQSHVQVPGTRTVCCLS